MKNFIHIFLLIASLMGIASAQSPGVVLPGRPIKIEIMGVPADEKSRIDAMYPVSESGTINLPFIGIVQAAGMRPEQLATVIQSRYRNSGIYTNPTIQVMSDSINTQIDVLVVHVGGQVRKTGPVPYTTGLTLYQAVQAAGGATEFGSMKRVSIFRAGKKTTYDLTKGQFMSIPLSPNDTIEVPQKSWTGN